MAEPGWRKSDVVTPLERDVLEYVEAKPIRHPPSPTNSPRACWRRSVLMRWLELTAHIALATLYSGTNTTHGIESQGLAASCELRPLTKPSGARRSPS